MAIRRSLESPQNSADSSSVRKRACQPGHGRKHCSSGARPLAGAAIRYRAGSARLTIAAGRRRDSFGFEDVDVTDGPLDPAITQQQVVISPAAVHVVVAEVELFDLRRGQRQAVRGPVPLDQLVLGYPVDLPRDG